ncbi:hypothetical protein H2200_000743 [Cladophialophora chaetospira]|uniref:Uncharacterized protein n=1 Tax=Cladophialophora chaetospira TaxID=386627 RepID=A0AA39CQM0_9EURO|nr:hypothetical protein H2200_000743 [Cladophialophora chaetospira]
MDHGAAPDGLRRGWDHPEIVFPILLVVGASVVRTALAQLAGGWVSPVPFSFGWVGYAFSTLTAVGRGKLMPQSPDTYLAINTKTGYARQSSRWILNRILDDFEYWMPAIVQRRIEDVRQTVWESQCQKALQKDGPSAALPVKTSRASLCVSVFEADFKAEAGRSARDLVFYSGILTTAVQLGIALIPAGLYGHWSILLITVVGSLLSYLTGVLPQWRAEKWSRRRHSTKDIVLTKGNGAQHAIAVIGNGHGLDLEDLAAPYEPPRTSFDGTSYIVYVFALLWTALLITTVGIIDHSWFLIAVGALGTLQNVAAASFRRNPSAYGVHLSFVECIMHPKVMGTLYLVEEKHPHMGSSMLSTFFPGSLRPEEEEKWNSFRQSAKARSKNVNLTANNRSQPGTESATSTAAVDV